MAAPRIHIAKSRCRLADGRIYQYAYVRYTIWDEKKERWQPKPLMRLGRMDRLDAERVDSLGGFLRRWLAKESDLPFEALAERLQEAEPTFQILCSQDFGLRWLIDQAWCDLGYKDVIEELASDSEAKFRVDLAIFAMVTAQLVAPRSKRGTSRWAGMEIFFPEAEALRVDHLYRAMDVLEKGADKVEQKLSERLAELGIETKQVAHDTTTISCAVRYDDEERKKIESERQARGEAQRAATVNDPPLRLRGNSKAKRPDLPQVNLELVLGDHGLIVRHETHPGNEPDVNLARTSARRVADLGYEDVAWAGDAGTNSAGNRRALRKLGFHAVLGEGVSRTRTVKRVVSRPGRYRTHPDRPGVSYKCVIAEAEEERTKTRKGRKRLYVIRRHKQERQHALHRIRRHIEHIQEVLDEGSPEERQALLYHRTYRKYVRRAANKKDAKGKPAGWIQLCPEKIAHMKHLAGKTVIGTDDLEAAPEAADGVYRQLFDVEHVFSQLKSTVEVGPIRHRRADRIRAHIVIAVMAENLARWLEIKSGRTFEELQNIFGSLRVQQVDFGKGRYWQSVELTAEQAAVLAKMGYDAPPRRFVTEVLGRGET